MLACRQDQFAFVMKLIKQNGIDVTSLLPTLDEQDCWCLDQDFEEVTAKLLTRRLWRERGSNSWRYLESIEILEARALLHGLLDKTETVLTSHAC